MKPGNSLSSSSAFGSAKEEPVDFNTAFYAQCQAVLTGHPDLLSSGISSLFPPLPREDNQEKQRIAQRLQGFNSKDNPAWKAIAQRFGPAIKQGELLSIATVLAENANIRLDRDAKRRKSVLLKWFEENWTAVSPFIDYVVLEDTNKP
jgi:hypothetical protein